MPILPLGQPSQTGAGRQLGGQPVPGNCTVSVIGVQGSGLIGAVTVSIS
jgi:hypothetical protein